MNSKYIGIIICSLLLVLPYTLHLLGVPDVITLLLVFIISLVTSIVYIARKTKSEDWLLTLFFVWLLCGCGLFYLVREADLAFFANTSSVIALLVLAYLFIQSQMTKNDTLRQKNINLLRTGYIYFLILAPFVMLGAKFS